ncbi:MAG: hypothetical protein SPJ23_03430 [Eubacteriales bacterium]|nr:hypothetical protein [Eubacteriales bacterium]
MNRIPELLKRSSTVTLQKMLFYDLQLNRVLSDSALSVLQNPCGKEEILRRQDLFIHLEDADCYAKIKEAFVLLHTLEHNRELLRNAENELARFHLQVTVLSDYIDVCEYLAALTECGQLFSEISAYFASEPQKDLRTRLRGVHNEALKILGNFHKGLLSFSGKVWITPVLDAADECDKIAHCAEKLGFAVREKINRNTKPDPTLADAILRLHAESAAQLRALFNDCASVDFAEPLSYLPGIRFFLEIFELEQKAAGSGAKHCFPSLSEKPEYLAKEVYDISLLAKSCVQIVPNDISFSRNEPFFFLTGANGGGKTTYLRAVGINLIFFLSGCPVYAKEARIYPFSFVASHFPTDERFENTGRLDEELLRVNSLLSDAEGQTAFLMLNETFSGADESQGFMLLQDTAERIRNSGHFGLYVTHFHEVKLLDYPLLSAVVDRDNDNKRTYRIIKFKGTVSSYAADILRKYGLDDESLSKRRS